jgi:chromosome segregation ATPase
MNFIGLMKRGDKMDKAFEELQEDVAEALDENLFLDEMPPLGEAEGDAEASGTVEDDLISAEELLADDDACEQTEPAEESPEVGRRLTSHTQNRLAALASFDELYRDAQQYLQDINAKLSEVTTSHHLTREFFNIIHSDIHRANELEFANSTLATENRKLLEQLHDAGKRQQERENAVETLQHREASLLQEKENLRAALSAAKLELVEAANTISRNESELGDLMKTLSARTVEAERRLRENEVLREKHVNLSIDLDNSLKREAEARRKLDEISAIHAGEAARYSELLATLAKSEKEAMRLQKALETAQAKQAEMDEAAGNLEVEREAEMQRTIAEMRGLRSEIQSLQSRLEIASNEQIETANEISKLKVQLNDAITEKHVAQERLSALKKENETDKLHLSAASANISQLSLQQASEQMQLDIHKQECEDLRAEIATLNDRIKELLPFERLYRVAKARQREATGGAPDVNGMAIPEAARATPRRTSGSGRRRAV